MFPKAYSSRLPTWKHQTARCKVVKQIEIDTTENRTWDLRLMSGQSYSKLRCMQLRPTRFKTTEALALLAEVSLPECP